MLGREGKTTPRSRAIHARRAEDAVAARVRRNVRPAVDGISREADWHPERVVFRMSVQAVVVAVGRDLVGVAAAEQGVLVALRGKRPVSSVRRIVVDGPWRRRPARRRRPRPWLPTAIFFLVGGSRWESPHTPPIEARANPISQRHASTTRPRTRPAQEDPKRAATGETPSTREIE